MSQSVLNVFRRRSTTQLPTLGQYSPSRRVNLASSEEESAPRSPTRINALDKFDRLGSPGGPQSHNVGSMISEQSIQYTGIYLIY